MLEFILNSRLRGKQVFTVYHGGGYVYRNGKQICVNGKHTGPTIRCNGDIESLEKTARHWWLHYLKNDKGSKV